MDPRNERCRQVLEKLSTKEMLTTRLFVLINGTTDKMEVCLLHKSK